MDNELKEQVFAFLDDLRDSGETNMYGASIYVREEFDLDKTTARELTTEWMRTFSERHPR